VQIHQQNEKTRALQLAQFMAFSSAGGALQLHHVMSAASSLQAAMGFAEAHLDGPRGPYQECARCFKSLGYSISCMQLHF
jgi:hypothetical protein